MKKPIFVFALVCSIGMICSQVFAEWTLISTRSDGVKTYVDFKNMNISKNYLYVWDLRDEVKPFDGKYLSSSILYQVDCTIPRSKTITYVWFKGNMGRKIAKQEDSVNKDWKYPAPTTLMFKVLKSACDFAKK